MEMNQPVGRTPLDDRPDGLVGKALNRVDGPLKVTGRAPYAYESRALKNPAYGYIVTATVAAGTINAIDAEAARKAPGAILVMTHENVPEQGEKKEQVWPQLQGTEVKFYGQPVAFVVAETFEQARAAAMLVKISYDAAKPKGLLRGAMAEAYEPKPMPTARGSSRTPPSVTSTAPLRLRRSRSMSSTRHPRRSTRRWSRTRPSPSGRRGRTVTPWRSTLPTRCRTAASPPSARC